MVDMVPIISHVHHLPVLHRPRDLPFQITREQALDFLEDWLQLLQHDFIVFSHDHRST